MNGKKRECRHGMPMAKAIFLTGIVAIMLIHPDSPASAEGDSEASLPANTQGTSDAPAGAVQSTFRVQPMLKDLPPGVAQTETKRTKAQIDFDKKLQICRKC